MKLKQLQDGTYKMPEPKSNEDDILKKIARKQMDREDKVKLQYSQDKTNKKALIREMQAQIADERMRRTQIE